MNVVQGSGVNSVRARKEYKSFMKEGNKSGELRERDTAVSCPPSVFKETGISPVKKVRWSNALTRGY